jgi:hypothetical protein
MEKTCEMRLPPQSPPVMRVLLASEEFESGEGLAAAQTQCDSLPGLAQQMCYLALYGVET